MSDVAAPALPASARDQFRRLAVLIATCFVDMIGFAMVLPILPFYALDLKASEKLDWRTRWTCLRPPRPSRSLSSASGHHRSGAAVSG